jgi:hypothetical protein
VYLMAVMYDPSKKAEFFAKRARRLLQRRTCERL